MDEYLLHYIWQSRHFNFNDLSTTDGQQLQILDNGKLNSDQGPDFLFAKVRVEDMLMVGHIELHVLSSDWVSHGHSGDPHYKNVILHVVWKNDRYVPLPFPTLELQSRVAKFSIDQYRHLKSTNNMIPCERLLQNSILDIFSAFSRKLVNERLTQRSKDIERKLNELKGDWEQLAWRKMAHYLGGEKNGDAMEILLGSIPFNVIQACASRRIQIEALLFGQAGFLNPGLSESYPKELLHEYFFLKKKFQLVQPRVEWMFFRMRPSHFPTIGIAKLSALIHSGEKLMSCILSEHQIEKMRYIMSKPLSTYWEDHYHFGKQTRLKTRKLGNTRIDNIIINVISPMLFSYGAYHNLNVFKERAEELLCQLKGEENHITNTMKSVGFVNETAFHSQALIQLHKMYCIPKRCLSCQIGISLLRPQEKSNPVVFDDGF